ncbi:MAG TPA: SRPBCC family protein [Candidatus Limnocylindrales bacterium]|jgi:uncharacterized protein YndB with AHSA1/START domain|nr:SRPBCC family protein [Candidatus Limnocylindrales bacterium]
MAEYEFTFRIAAPPDVVFDLWTDLDRMREWVGGVTKVTDRTGPIDRAGTRYTVWFGRMTSPTEVIAVERPRTFRTRFGNRVLRGESGVTLEPDDGGTILTQRFRTEGLIPALMARIFASGSYQGSFRGELEAFARIVEGEAGAARR